MESIIDMFMGKTDSPSDDDKRKLKRDNWHRELRRRRILRGRPVIRGGRNRKGRESKQLAERDETSLAKDNSPLPQ